MLCFQVLDLAANIYKQIPENIDYDGTAKILALDPCPLNVVLLQEVMFEDMMNNGVINPLHGFWSN